jgi:hypothetical protein
MFNAVSRWRGAVLCLFFSLAIGFLTPAAWAGSGRGGGDDDDEHDSGDSDGGEGGADDGGAAGDGGDADDGGDSGESDDGGESGGGSDDGGEGGDDGPDDSGSGGEGGEGGDSGSGGEGGEGGEGGDDKSGPSANSGRSFDDDELVSVSRNEAGESIREGEAIVLTGKADFAQRLPAKGFRLVESFRVETIGASALRIAVPGSMSERDALDALQKLDPKGIVTFNHVYNPAGAAPALGAAVGATTPKKRVRAKVGLVDAAVDTKHPMLKEVVVNARSFDPATKPLNDSHGTAVASLIAEAAPGATVFAANVFTFSTDGREIATADAIVRGLDWLGNMKVAVINLSLTGPANPILEAMIQRLSAKGHLLVAAVGNEGPRGAPQFPAAYDKVVGVTAVDGKNRVYLYANHGDYVDFAAPGVDRRVANTEGSTETVSGTSYASPIVAARLAASLDVPDVARAKRAVETLAAEARDLGAPGRDPVFGHGLIGD